MGREPQKAECTQLQRKAEASMVFALLVNGHALSLNNQSFAETRGKGLLAFYSGAS
jgi:hypothetical protein